MGMNFKCLEGHQWDHIAPPHPSTEECGSRREGEKEAKRATKQTTPVDLKAFVLTEKANSWVTLYNLDLENSIYKYALSLYYHIFRNGNWIGLRQLFVNLSRHSAR